MGVCFKFQNKAVLHLLNPLQAVRGTVFTLSGTQFAPPLIENVDREGYMIAKICTSDK